MQANVRTQPRECNPYLHMNYIRAICVQATVRTPPREYVLMCILGSLHVKAVVISLCLTTAVGALTPVAVLCATVEQIPTYSVCRVP